MGNEIDIHAPGVEMRKSLCYFCHANCGVLAYVKDGEVIKIEGDPNYANQGGLCCRGNSALLHLNHPARINHALKRVGAKGEGKWEKIPYDQAIAEVAERLNQIKAESGAEAVATAEGNVAAALADDRYADALVALAALRAPVDEFFDTTMVMDEDPEVRANRLKLLNRFANVFAHVADFSQMAKK